MVRPEHHYRVFLQVARSQRLQNPSYLGVKKADTCQVSPHLPLPLPRTLQELSSMLRESPMQIPGKGRRVLAVITPDERQDRFVIGIEIKPLLGRKERHMRQPNSHREEKWLPWQTPQPFRRPARDLPVASFFIPSPDHSPVITPVLFPRERRKPLIGIRPVIIAGTCQIKLTIPRSKSETTVEDLARRQRPISVPGKILREAYKLP